MLGGPCSQHVTGNTSRQNQSYSAIMFCMEPFTLHDWNQRRQHEQLEIVAQWFTRTPPTNRRGSKGNAWIAIEHRSKSFGFYIPILTDNVLLKFGFDVQSQIEVKSPETEKPNMAPKRPFWKLHCWKSIDFFPYARVICYWSIDLISNAKLKLRVRKPKKNWYGHQAAILKVTSLKINGLFPYPQVTIEV